jgi:hypothetical protein
MAEDPNKKAEPSATPIIPEPTFQGPPDGVTIAAPPQEFPDWNPVHPYGTDRSYDDPADANLADIEAAIGAEDKAAAPQPFRKREGDFPDLTQESVNCRMLEDYWPHDWGRHQNNAWPRARKGELVAFPSDEALSLIEQGIAEREDAHAEERADEQRQRWKDRDEDRKRAEDEAKRRREADGA